MTDYSHPFILIKPKLREYYELCNAGDFIRAYEVAVDIAELADELVEIAQNNANCAK